MVSLENNRDTILKDQKGFYVMTKSDMQLYNAANMQLFNKFDNLFVEAPARKAPQNIFMNGNVIVGVNDQVFYILATNVENFGKFSVPLPGNYVFDPYNVCRSILGQTLVFDQTTRSFKRIYTVISERVDALNNAGAYPCNNMDYDLVFMQEKKELSGGMAIMKKKDANEYYGLTFAFGVMSWEQIFANNPISTFVRIPDDYHVSKGKFFGVHKTMNNLYFSEGNNEVWTYDVASPAEKKILTLASDESVAFVDHISYSGTDRNVNYLVVLTNKGGDYNCYLYNFKPSSAEVETPAYATYSGKGNPRHIMYRGITSTSGY
jgi:hypothetical protein